jgi:tetratricopeptide (TPR) repeat protein
MSLGVDYDTRLIIPRSHLYKDAVKLGTLTPLNVSATPNIFTPETHEENINNWLVHKKIPYAVELLSSAAIIDDFDNQTVLEAADFILSKESEISPIVYQLANSVKSERFPSEGSTIIGQHWSDFVKIQTDIAELKRRVREYPGNAIAWSDLALLYASINQTDKSLSAIKAALSLSTENRFILRNTSRLLLHFGNPDAALYYLRKGQVTKCDPSLIAAEIAFSNLCETPSERIKVGRELLKSGHHSEFQLSELAGNIGTLEYVNGGGKRGKKYINFSLHCPNENTIAQAHWLSSEFGNNFLDNFTYAPASYEANAIKQMKAKNYKEVVNSCNDWLGYQPLSSMPAIRGSYVAITALNEYKIGIELCEKALIASPNNPVLRNNLACSLALNGDIEQASKTIESIKGNHSSEDELLTVQATQGLIEYKKLNFDKARELYGIAVEGFVKLKDRKSLAVAFNYWGREEKLVDSQFSAELIKKSKELAKVEGMHELLPQDD